MYYCNGEEFLYSILVNWSQKLHNFITIILFSILGIVQLATTFNELKLAMAKSHAMLLTGLVEV